MGEEAVLETDRLTLNDTSMLLVRQAVQRVRRGGYTALIRRFTELDEQQHQQVAEGISASRLYHFNLKFAPLWVPHFFGDGADVGDGECYVCCGHGGGLFTESVGTPFVGSEAGSFYR